MKKQETNSSFRHSDPLFIDKTVNRHGFLLLHTSSQHNQRKWKTVTGIFHNFLSFPPLKISQKYFKTILRSCLSENLQSGQGIQKWCFDFHRNFITSAKLYDLFLAGQENEDFMNELVLRSPRVLAQCSMYRDASLIDSVNNIQTRLALEKYTFCIRPFEPWFHTRTLTT